MMDHGPHLQKEEAVSDEKAWSVIAADCHHNEQ
jgi:hypothetical protein